MPVLPTFNISVPLWDNHTPIKLRSGWVDCMHYCHPGIPETWLWRLYEAFRAGQGSVTPLPDAPSAETSRRCDVLAPVAKR